MTQNATIHTYANDVTLSTERGNSADGRMFVRMTVRNRGQDKPLCSFLMGPDQAKLMGANLRELASVK